MRPAPDPDRRLALGLLLALASPVLAQSPGLERLRRGGVVALHRHALAPGTFDPPELDLARCETQRNLSEAGREQARRLGEAYRQAGLRPARVRSSPWCRCLDTARLAFGDAEPWAALGSPGRTPGWEESAQLAALQEALRQRAAAGGFEVWITHQFTASSLVGGVLAPAGGLVVGSGPAGVLPLGELDLV